MTKGTRDYIGSSIPRRKRYKLTGNIVNRLKGKGYSRDKAYDVGYLGHGGTALAKGKEGAMSRVKSGAEFHCELCEITGMTLSELHAHWRKVHQEATIDNSIAGV